MNVEGVTIDVDKMMEQKTKAVGGLTKGIEGLFKKNKVEYVPGWGKFKSATEVEVDLLAGGSRTLTAKDVIIATGSEVLPLPGVPIDEERIVSSTGALSLKKVPKTMVVIGGGYIGLEMGSGEAVVRVERTACGHLSPCLPLPMLAKGSG